MNADNKITDQQRKLIMVAAKQLGLGDIERHALTESVTGKASTKDLTMEEANKVIREMGKKGAEFEKRPRPAAKTGDNVIPLISLRQKDKVHELIEELGWDEDRLAGFVKRQTGSRLTGAVEELNALTLQEGQKVIEGLKKIIARMPKGGDAA